MDFCEQMGCTRCCVGQMRPLLNQDVDQIVATGHYDSFFSKPVNGWLVLQNLDGKCVFCKDSRCDMKNRRPTSCRLAPYIYDDETGQVVIDEHCQYANKINPEEAMRAAVKTTVRRLIDERDLRIKKTKR